VGDIERGQRKKVLLFSLANVLGHLARTLALAEQLYEDGQDVYIAAPDDYSELLNVLPSGINIMSSIEMFADTTKSINQITYSENGTVNEFECLEASCHLEPGELRRRAARLKKILQHDTAIIDDVCPDAIVMDYHYAPLLIPKVADVPLFFLSHRLGYPSLYRRVHGEYPYPLNENPILVPGISSIEGFEGGGDKRTGKNNWHMCGMFYWQGWKRVGKGLGRPEKSDIFLFFGSTGCAEKLTPWFINNLPSRYRLSYLDHLADGKFLNPGCFLKQTSVVICHGGHGTVLECIRHQKPMIIIPNNVEQLEIGRKVERLKLGVLISQPYSSVDIDALTEIIEHLKQNQEISNNLSRYASLLNQHDGARVAADIIGDQLHNRTAAAI